MTRLVLASVVTGLATVAVAVAPSAQANSSGMSAEFPVGRCIDVPKQLVFNPADQNLMRNETDNLIYLTSVPCTDPGRDYRVVAQVAEEGLCGSDTSDVFYTRDVRVLCVVDDHV